MKYKFFERNGKYWSMDEDEKIKRITSTRVKELKKAQGTGSIEAGALKAGDRALNAVNTVLPKSMEGHQSKVMGNLLGLIPGFESRTDMPSEGEMTALEQTHPVATTVGDIVPYMAAAPAMPAVGMTGAVGLGAAEGFMFSNPGDEFIDTAVGGITGPIGNMAHRVINGISQALKGTAYKEPLLTANQYLRGKRGTFDKSASALGGKRVAEAFGRENQTRLNQLAADMLGLDPKMYKDIPESALTNVEESILKRNREIEKILVNANDGGMQGPTARKLMPEIGELRKKQNAVNLLRGKRITNFAGVDPKSVKNPYVDANSNAMNAKQLVNSKGNVRPERIMQSDFQVASKSQPGTTAGVIENMQGQPLTAPTASTPLNPSSRYPEGYDALLERSRMMEDPELGMFRGDERSRPNSLYDYVRAPDRAARTLPHFLASSAPMSKGVQASTGLGIGIGESTPVMEDVANVGLGMAGRSGIGLGANAVKNAGKKFLESNWGRGVLGVGALNADDVAGAAVDAGGALIEGAKKVGGKASNISMDNATGLLLGASLPKQTIKKAAPVIAEGAKNAWGYTKKQWEGLSPSIKRGIVYGSAARGGVAGKDYYDRQQRQPTPQNFN